MTIGTLLATLRAAQLERLGPGVKVSGYGRFGGGEAMREFTEMRRVTVQGQGGRPFPF